MLWLREPFSRADITDSPPPVTETKSVTTGALRPANSGSFICNQMRCKHRKPAGGEPAGFCISL